VRIGGEYAGPAVLRGKALRVGVTVHLVIEIDELEIDGRRIDGYRTWVGVITTADDHEADELTAAQDLRIELPDGRYAACLVLDEMRVVGLGPPPFT
jgi:hypothetical protein